MGGTGNNPATPVLGDIDEAAHDLRVDQLQADAGEQEKSQQNNLTPLVSQLFNQQVPVFANRDRYNLYYTHHHSATDQLGQVLSFKAVFELVGISANRAFLDVQFEGNLLCGSAVGEAS